MPALQSVTARSSSLASAYSTMRARVPSGARMSRPYSAGSSGRKPRTAAAAPAPSRRAWMSRSKVSAPDQRRVRIEHEHVAVEILQQWPGLSHRMGGAEGLFLHHAGDRARRRLPDRRLRPRAPARSPGPCARAQAHGRWPARAPPSAARRADGGPSAGLSACACPCPPQARRRQARSPAPPRRLGNDLARMAGQLFLQALASTMASTNRPKLCERLRAGSM